METELNKCFEEAIWVCRTLFQSGKVTESSANISFRCGDSIYISGSGTCFGTIVREQFAEVSLSGEVPAGPKPSKELPIHLAFYRKDPKIMAVVHTDLMRNLCHVCLRRMRMM
ncbi:MAG: class II aldolase/adducin family protein [Solobacterium sp.]|nr:class II aldolase/adducin family protein [Solobacterium sp.]